MLPLKASQCGPLLLNSENTVVTITSPTVFRGFSIAIYPCFGYTWLMMIYMDNAATSLHKPPAVANAMAAAVGALANPGRGSYPGAMQAARAILETRLEVARLVGAESPDCVAFTSGVTESLNLLIGTLIGPEDAVLTTVLEHNSVLRPLYQTGCTLQFVGCDDEGHLQLDALPQLLAQNTRFMVCTTGSNLLGSVTDVAQVSAFCRKNGLALILDTAQTLGCVPLAAHAADFLCFAGHKGLLGPQGTGGVVSCFRSLPDASNITPYLKTEKPFKTGGTGSDSFARHQPLRMPDMLEAGTPNVPGLCGLREGLRWVHQTGPAAIWEKEQTLTAQFLEGLATLPHIHVYGSTQAAGRLPVVALNVERIDSEEVALRLWEDYNIAVRPGSHCAPLAHRRFGTEKTGMVRFSFGFSNTAAEIDAAISALREIAS